MKTILSTLMAILLFSCADDNKNTQQTVLKKDSIIITHDSSRLIKASPGKCTIDNEVASLGIGLVIAPKTFALYNDSLLASKPLSIDMYEQADSLANICSMVFDPEYGLMHFACTGETENAYQVLINRSETRYLPKKKENQFQTWEQYLLHSFGVRRKTEIADENEKPLTDVRKAPNDTAAILPIPAQATGHEMFCALQVQGDWLQVKYDCFYNDEDSKYEGQPCHNFISKCADSQTGWLRWRQNNKLLVDIYLMP
jgi:hypothetical protein